MKFTTDNAAENGQKGGLTTQEEIRARFSFSLDELQTIETVADAKKALVQIRDAILTGRIKQDVGRSAGAQVHAWIEAEHKAQTLAASKHVVDELMREHEALKKRLKACTCGAAGTR